MAAKVYYSPFIPAFSSNGAPVPGAQLRFRLTGTTTPTPIYTTSALNVEHPNPVVANAAGRFPAIFLNDAVTYRVDILDADGTQLDSIDPYVPGTALKGDTGPAGTAAANSGVGTTWTTETANTSAQSLMHTLDEPTVAFTNSAGGDDGVNARLIVNVGKFNQGPTGHATYFDTVLGLGLNMTTSYTPANPGIAAASYRIESKFAQGGASDPFASEFHTSIYSADATPVEARPISVFAPHLKADWAAHMGVSFRAGQVSFNDGTISPDASGTERVKFDFRPGQPSINLAPNGAERAPGFSMASNNVYFARQINAAGNAFFTLPYIDSDDFLRTLNVQTVHVGEAKANGTYGISAFQIGQCTNLPASGFLDQMFASNSVTGSVTAIERRAIASGDVLGLLENAGAGTATFNVQGSAASGFAVNGTKVVGARSTGWTAMTGTGSKAALAAAAAGTASASYVQAELQGALNRIAALEARLKSYDDALVAHGLIGA